MFHKISNDVFHLSVNSCNEKDCFRISVYLVCCQDFYVSCLPEVCAKP